MTALRSEAELVAIAGSLAGPEAPYSAPERRLLKAAGHASRSAIAAVRALIKAGEDPLGEAFCQLRSQVDRRAQGAVYTPPPIVSSMVSWATEEGSPARVVDPGSGSGRFILAAAKAFPNAALVAVDTDPLAVLMLRANAAVLGLAGRLSAHCQDYCKLSLSAIEGVTLFIGNPPYVRHHDIDARSKTWFAKTARTLGFKASTLAGLHIHFFLKTRQIARPGDYGVFITSAEWLDVNYGSVLRKMLGDGLGGTALHVLTPESMPFADVATTGAITCFHVSGRRDAMTVRSVDSLEALNSLKEGRPVTWSELDDAPRWSALIRAPQSRPSGFVELGELFRVHRGQVTGSNNVWIAGAYEGALPESALIPTITRARELIAAGSVLKDAAHLRRVIDLPVDLDALDPCDRKAVDRFLSWARKQGAHETYIATYRRAWWSVGLREPAPILCTYMARRPPAFVLNQARARHINIAHGLYPREPLSKADLSALARYLGAHVATESGRTYAGGLTKFEPKELERILIPRLEVIHDIAATMDNTGTGTGRGGRSGRVSHRTA